MTMISAWLHKEEPDHSEPMGFYLPGLKVWPGSPQRDNWLPGELITAQPVELDEEFGSTE